MNLGALPPCYGIIPARYGSSRFPGKPLALILGKPMFWHVYDRARQCPDFVQVVLATDDERIRAAAEGLGVPVAMTSQDHASGTDRVLEAARALGAPDDAVVVNIQGDEPALDPRMLCDLTAPFADPATQVTTLAHAIDADRALSPDQVKVVFTNRGLALYFSRAPIPNGAGHATPFWGHIGMYAFRMRALTRFCALGQSPLERLERLEQLRLLEDGIPIRVVPTTYATRGVDRPEDIPYVETLLTETLHGRHSGA